MRQGLSLLFLLCLFGITHAQQIELKVIDSVENARIQDILSKAEAVYSVDLDSALYYVDNALLNLKPYEAPVLRAKTLLYKSKYLLYKKEYGSIIQELQPNLENKDKIGLTYLGRTYLDIGHAYKQEWLPDSSVVYYIRALKAFEKTQNKRDISLTYLSLGLVYSRIGNKELSKSFYDKSLKYSTNSRIMQMHKDQFTAENEDVSYDMTIEFSMDIAKMAEERNDDRLLVVTYSDIRSDFYRLENYDKALEFAEKELALRQKMSFDSHIPNTLFFIGDINLKKGNYRNAISSFQEAMIEAPDSLKLNLFEGMKDAYLGLSKYPEAIQMMEKYDSIKTIITNKNIEASITEITSQYQDEQQKQEIKTLSFQNEANMEKIANQRLTLFSIIGGSLLLFLLGLFVYRNYRSKQELNYAQLNFKLLQTQLNPHFLFNALNEIKLNLKSGDEQDSSNYLTSYSRLMRLILEGSDQEFVTLKEEASLIEKYLHLQQLVYNKAFNYEVIVDDELDTQYLEVPPMLTQPLVENAIIHGVSKIENGFIKVHYKSSPEGIAIFISDNGKGMMGEKNQAGKGLHRSFGREITHDRIKNYLKLYDFKIDIDTKSSESDGTQVIIKLPLRIKAA